MYEIRVYGKNRDIPWFKDNEQTHIHLIAGAPRRTDDEDMVEHLRKFHQPQEGRGIEITEVGVQPKSVRSMNAEELRMFADSKGVEYSETDSRMDIMKKLKRGVKQNG
jgi:hypothetical protein